MKSQFKSIIKKAVSYIVMVWNKLPPEVQVTIFYIPLSLLAYSTECSNVPVQDILKTYFYNILLIFLLRLKKRGGKFLDKVLENIPYPI